MKTYTIIYTVEITKSSFWQISVYTEYIHQICGWPFHFGSYMMREHVTLWIRVGDSREIHNSYTDFAIKNGAKI